MSREYTADVRSKDSERGIISKRDSKQSCRNLQGQEKKRYFFFKCLQARITKYEINLPPGNLSPNIKHVDISAVFCHLGKDE